jgi:UTP:GlnB (protein PII) uridylyltransferase
MCRVFDRHEVEWQQALITTTGNQVSDTFYLAPEDAARLEGGGFAERLVSLIDALGQAPGEASL